MPTPKFSEVFRLASTLLQTDTTTEENCLTYSCPAISQAYAMLSGKDYNSGCPARGYYPLADVPYFDAFIDIPPGQEQSARFLWLCMLAEIAESEGV